MDFDKAMTSTKNHDDLGIKMDMLCRKMDYYEISLRQDDDKLLMTLYETHHSWFELTKRLSGDIRLLNKRIMELEQLILKISCNS